MLVPSGVEYPNGVAVDSSGNVYIADGDTRQYPYRHAPANADAGDYADPVSRIPASRVQQLFSQ